MLNHGALAIRPARKRSTYELPPDDASDFERPLLRRRTTLQAYVALSSDADPYVPRFVDEPLRLPNHDESIEEIDRMARGDLSKLHDHVLKSLSRASTGWSSIPSRASTVVLEDEVAHAFVGLSVHDTYEGYTYDSKSDYGPPSGISECAASSQTTAANRQSKQRAAQSSNNRRTSSRRSSAIGQDLNLGIVAGSSSRVKKPAGKTPGKGKQPEKSQQPLGCPMVKGSPHRYENVIGPCTERRGIHASAKALNEHLKKQHSRYFRCMPCWKWHSKEEELLEHIKRGDQFRCCGCDELFDNRNELDAHLEISASCKVNPLTKPELFNEEQEVFFAKNKNKSGRVKDSVEAKFFAVFDGLFPYHPESERKLIRPHYDFVCFTHRLPEDMRRPDQVDQYAGRMTIDAAQPVSPSDETTQGSSPSIQSPHVARQPDRNDPNQLGTSHDGQWHESQGRPSQQHALSSQSPPRQYSHVQHEATPITEHSLSALSDATLVPYSQSMHPPGHVHRQPSQSTGILTLPGLTEGTLSTDAGQSHGPQTPFQSGAYQPPGQHSSRPMQPPEFFASFVPPTKEQAQALPNTFDYTTPPQQQPQYRMPPSTFETPNSAYQQLDFSIPGSLDYSQPYTPMSSTVYPQPQTQGHAATTPMYTSMVMQSALGVASAMDKNDPNLWLENVGYGEGQPPSGNYDDNPYPEYGQQHDETQ